jgi:proteasome lid subunit RPN8/RPN11
MSVPGLSNRVRKPIYDHVFENDDHEVGGILVGRLGDDGLPVVTGSIAALEAEGRRASVTFTHDAWATIHRRLESEFSGQEIVGWYHSHPGFGIFLSEYDRFIHGNFFGDHRQIAYVIDPHAGTEGVFRWQDHELVLIAEERSARAGTGGAGRGSRGWRERAQPKSRLVRIRSAVALGVVAALSILAIVLATTTQGSEHVGRHIATPAPSVGGTGGVRPSRARPQGFTG